MARFKQDLDQMTWNEVISSTNVDDCYDKFWDYFEMLHNQHFTLVSHRFNKNIHKNEDFMTNGLLNSRRQKIRLHKTALSDNSIPNWTKYKTYRNLFNKTLRASKRLHYDNQLKANIRNPKKTWDILKELTTGHKTQSTIDKITVDNQVITDPTNMADNFNKFFTGIGRKIHDSVTPTQRPPTDYLTDANPPKLKFDNITEQHVIDVINIMDPKTSQDACGISMKMIKTIKQQIAKPLAHLFTLSVTTGVFPAKLKTSRTVPIFKAGDCTSCDNYRPISLLSSISKILEKIIAIWLVNHLEINKLLFNNQFGFLRNHSTVHNLTQLVNKITKEINDKNFVIGIFLDLKKAFDVVPHDILLTKLKNLGLAGHELKWFTSYLDNRQQYVDINGHSSTNRTIDISVLQGSILGPILFLCYINDLPMTTNLFTVLFADDTACLAAGKNLTELIKTTNIEIQKLANWFRANRMAVNTSKTKYIIFRPKGVRLDHDFDNHGIVYNDNEIGQPDDPSKITNLDRVHNGKTKISDRTYKYLGILIDENLTFDAHCNHVCTKLASSNYIINRAKNFLPQQSLKTLYYSLVHPHLLYGLPIFSCTSKKNINKIYKFQKKAIRKITKSKYNEPTAKLFNNLSILTFEQLIIYSKGLLIHSIFHKYSPTALHDTWKTNRQRGIEHDLRDDHQLYIPFARTDQTKKLPFISLPTIWNELPDFKLTPNKTTFKIALKQHLHDATLLALTNQ